MLAGHPRLFCPPELHLLAFSGMKAWHDALGPAHLDEGLQRALMELGGQDGPAARRQIAEWVAADLPVQEVYAFLQRAAGDRTLVDKSPTYAGRLDNLRQAEVIFDRPRYIWLVRHPYAAIESFVRNRLDRLVEIQGSDPLTLGEEYWTRCNANLADFLAGIEPDRQRQVRFEDLARDPEAVCHSLCEFLAVPFDERLLTPYDGRRMTDGVHAASLGVGDPGFLRRHAIEPALADAWRIVRLPRAVRENCRRMADRLGYELTAEPASSGAASAAAAGPAPAEVTAPVALQPKGSKPPLFLMHPSSGVVYPFRDLAGLLGEDRPCYAFEDPYLQDGKPRHNSVADYAADYLQGLRQRQPHGPYFLGGYSFGGHVAFEIACRLRAEGETVALVLLLDTEAISQAPEAATSQRWRQWLHMTAGAPRLAPDLAGLIRQAYEGPNPATVGATLRGLVHMHEHVRLILKHRPSFYPGTVTLVRAAGQTTRRHYTDDALGWNGVAADVRVRPVAGNHLQIVRPPYVTELAAAVRASLDEAEEAISVGGGGAQR
jgi:thioesterase domain-containing protein